MNKGDKSYLPKEILRLVAYCPLCDAPAQPTSVRVLREQDDMQLIHIDCSHCHSSILSLVVQSSFGLTSVGLVTDLKSDEVMNFKAQNQVTADDVINLHNLFYPSK